MEGNHGQYEEFVRAKERSRSVGEFKDILDQAKSVGDAKDWATEQSAYAIDRATRAKEEMQRAMEA